MDCFFRGTALAVMPDLIRHPEVSSSVLTGFRLSPE